MNIFLSIGLVCAFCLLSIRMRWLTWSGGTVAGLFGFCLLQWGGLPWIAPVLLFFGTSSVLSKIGPDQLQREDHRRNAMQVLANGGVAWLLLILATLWPGQGWYVAFAGALAAATADTWGSELGRLFDGKAFSIVTGKRVRSGTSGGVSWQGTLGGLAGACLIGVSSGAAIQVEMVLSIAMAGVLGSLVDSFLGATSQARYKIPATGEVLEAPDVEGSYLYSGWPWMTNETVNLLCSAAGAASAWILNQGIAFFGE